MRRAILAIAMLATMAGAANAAVAISSKATKNVNCASGTCTATAANAVLNVSDLQTMLASSDVVVRSGAGAVNIGVTAALTWASANRLTLDADASVNFHAPVVVSGPGALTIVTNHAGSGGDYNFRDTGRIAFWDLSSSLIINGNAFLLVGDVAGLRDAVLANGLGHYALANDYDATPDGNYTVAPVEAFYGVFEGLNNAIDHLSIQIPANSNGIFGLFSRSYGTLRDIALTNVDVSKLNYAGSSTAGALVGSNIGTVLNASASGVEVRSLTAGGLVGLNTGTIAYSRAAIDLPNRHPPASNNLLGGLVGRNYKGTILQSYATGNASGGSKSSVGGLVGLNDHGAIVQSYATGASDAYQHRSITGGLVGYDRGTISQSYSTGPSTVGRNSHAGGLIGVQCCQLGTTTTSYWDTTTSLHSSGCGKGDCSGVTGLTDAQLKSGLPAGFDPTVWGSDPAINGGLPYLLALPPS